MFSIFNMKLDMCFFTTLMLSTFLTLYLPCAQSFIISPRYSLGGDMKNLYQDTRVSRRHAKADNEDDEYVREKQLWKNFSSKRLKTELSEFDLIRFFDFVSVLGQKTLDTVEDALLHYRRLEIEDSYIDTRLRQESAADCLKQWNTDTDSRPRVLVIGSGWGAHAVIKIIDSLDDGYRVLCVSPKNYFLFTPMLASTSVGTIEFRSIVEPIRDANPTVSFLEGSVIDIDPFQKSAEVILNDKEDNTLDQSNDKKISIPYDIAIYACGVQAGGSSGNKKIEGVNNQNCHFLKDIPDALRLRISVGDMLERASRPGLSDDDRRKILHIVVVGGGATGVEYVGELTDCINDITSTSRKAPYSMLNSFVSITLIHGGDSLLPQFEKPLRQNAMESLLSRGVNVRVNTRVSRVLSPTSLEIYDKGNPDQLETLDCGIIIWAAGTEPVPLTECLIEKLDQRARNMGQNGRLPVDKWLRVIGAPAGSLFALGDASIVVSDDKADILPQTAQVAAQQGAFVARLLNRGYDLAGENKDNPQHDSLKMSPPISIPAKNGDIETLIRLRGNVEANPFKFLNLGILAFLGGGEALSQIQIGDKKIIKAGSAGFLLWRSVYIVKQVSTRSRVLILFDWFKCQIFGRDMTRL